MERVSAKVGVNIRFGIRNALVRNLLTSKIKNRDMSKVKNPKEQYAGKRTQNISRRILREDTETTAISESDTLNIRKRSIGVCKTLGSGVLDTGVWIA